MENYFSTRFAKQHICITHRHRQHCGDGQRGKGVGAEWRRAHGENEDISNSVNNKDKEKNDITMLFTSNTSMWLWFF